MGNEWQQKLFQQSLAARDWTAKLLMSPQTELCAPEICTPEESQHAFCMKEMVCDEHSNATHAVKRRSSWSSLLPSATGPDLSSLSLSTEL